MWSTVLQHGIYNLPKTVMVFNYTIGTLLATTIHIQTTVCGKFQDISFKALEVIINHYLKCLKLH